MKVLIDLTSLADNFSGIERYAACLTKEMVADTSIGYVLVFKDSVHEIFSEDVNRDNVEVLILRRCNKLFFNQIRLPNAIRRIKADYYLFLAFPVPVFLFKKNMVSTIHDICCWDCPETMNSLSKWYFRISHRVALKKCRAIITVSEFSKNRIVDRLHYDKDKIWLIYCGVDEKFINFKHNPLKENEVRNRYHLPDEYILSLSTLEPRKNLPLLINAYEQLIEKGTHLPPLVLAGRKGWKMDKILESISTEVKDNIIFTGFVDDEDLPIVYANAELFVFPSMYEGFGLPPLEAIACGVRVISSDAASMPEVLGNAAIYFKNKNRDDLERVLEEETRSSAEQSDSTANGIEQVKKFNWSKAAQELLSFLSKGSNQKRGERSE